MTAAAVDAQTGGDCLHVESVGPDSPFTAVSYHFGMLLGVDDFETDQGYHRGKHRLHNGWLHGPGVIWGFEVTFDRGSGELRVDPGLALDAAGRELYLPVRACVSLPRWYEQHAQDEALRVVLDAGPPIRFPAHVELRACSCLGRQVPAIADPCDGADRDTAYSRLQESVDIRLVPGPPPERTATHRRLRVLFGLEPPGDTPDDRAARDARANVLAAAPENRSPALLEAFRRLCVPDSIAWRPPDVPDGDPPALLPGGDDEPLTIADLPRITLESIGAEGFRATEATVEMAGRATLLPTAAIQELLCGLFPDGGGGGGGGPALPPPVVDAGGPRVRPDTVARAGADVSFEVDRELLAATVDRAAFRVASLTDTGWQTIAVHLAGVSADGLTVTLNLQRDPGPAPLRVLVRGTGQTPLLGDGAIPFAGGPDSPPGTEHDGHDFVVMLHS